MKYGRDGFLYISDSANSRIRRIDTAGVITNYIGFGPAKETYGAGLSGDGGPPAKAQIFTASDIAFDSAGSLYISDSGNNRIRVVRDGVVKTMAGTGQPGFGGDGGPAIQAKLHTPQKLAVDGQGNIIFADRVNGRVRKIDPSGKITTIAGSGAPAGILLTSKQ
jgi:sugar lactone lactonase YvrE